MIPRFVLCFSFICSIHVYFYLASVNVCLGCMVCREMQNAQVNYPIVQENEIKKKRKKTERRKRVERSCIERRL